MVPCEFYFWLMAYAFVVSVVMTIVFYLVQYGGLATKWRAIETRVILSRTRRRCIMSRAVCQMIQQEINDYDQVSRAFDQFSATYRLVAFFYIFASSPCNCVGLYLIIYLRSSFENWIIAVGGTLTVTLEWAGIILFASACKPKVLDLIPYALTIWPFIVLIAVKLLG